MRNKELIKQKSEELIELTTAFCKEHLDEEYMELCVYTINKMGRKRTVPFLSGRLTIWAAAVIHALGSTNFLFDKSFEPYVTAGDISEYFGTSKSTVSQKSKKIRDMFKMHYFCDEFSTKAMQDSNPIPDLIKLNGFIVDVRDLPPEIRKMIEEERAKEKKRRR